MINKVLPHQWMRIQTGHGTKGTREYDWAWLDVRSDDTPNGHKDYDTSVLVARWHRYPGETSLFRCWSPEDVTLAQPVGGDLPTLADRGDLPTRQDLHRPG
ncbi:hypothetical protein [Streptomyces sp. NPDC001020]